MSSSPVDDSTSAIGQTPATSREKGEDCFRPFFHAYYSAMKLKSHIFVCTNERPPEHPRGCCKEKNSEELILAFKKELKKHGLTHEVRAQRAGCLDVCEFGPAIVIYPEGVWYGKVNLEDVSEIVQSHLIEGKGVERLKIRGK